MQAIIFEDSGSLSAVYPDFRKNFRTRLSFANDIPFCNTLRVFATLFFLYYIKKITARQAITKNLKNIRRG